MKKVSKDCVHLVWIMQLLSTLFIDGLYFHYSYFYQTEYDTTSAFFLINKHINKMVQIKFYSNL